MHCPKCLIDLTPLTIENTIIDICSQCHGIFLDQGEIIKLASIPLPKIPEILFIQNQTTNSKQNQEKPYENELSCPKCQQLMQKFPYAGLEDIIIDTCRNQCGVWLDVGEIIKIMHYLQNSHHPINKELQEKIQFILSQNSNEAKMSIWQKLSKRYYIFSEDQSQITSSPIQFKQEDDFDLIIQLLKTIFSFLIKKKQYSNNND